MKANGTISPNNDPIAVAKPAMPIAASQVGLAEGGHSVYVLHWGEYEDKVTTGPFVGVADLDLGALTEDYRRDRYAAADDAKKDTCWLSEGDFTEWLLAVGKLVPVQTEHVSLDTFSDSFVPTHWPACPECGGGRGQPEYGRVRRSLNRITTYRRCTECRHEWGHIEVANDERLPMLEDDGRDTTNGCVPFALGKACGIAFAEVAQVCARHGWSSEGGMVPANAVLAARELGFDLIRHARHGVGTAHSPTLKRLVAELPRDRNYILGLREHWLAVVRGGVMDNDANSGGGRKVWELYEVRRVQALA